MGRVSGSCRFRPGPIRMTAKLLRRAIRETYLEFCLSIKSGDISPVLFLSGTVGLFLVEKPVQEHLESADELIVSHGPSPVRSCIFRLFAGFSSVGPDKISFQSPTPFISGGVFGNRLSSPDRCVQPSPWTDNTTTTNQSQNTDAVSADLKKRLLKLDQPDVPEPGFTSVVL